MLFLVFLLIFLKNIKALTVRVPWRGHDALVIFFLQLQTHLEYVWFHNVIQETNISPNNFVILRTTLVVI